MQIKKKEKGLWSEDWRRMSWVHESFRYGPVFLEFAEGEVQGAESSAKESEAFCRIGPSILLGPLGGRVSSERILAGMHSHFVGFQF